MSVADLANPVSPTLSDQVLGLEVMADGQAFSLTSTHQELSVLEAADILGVSEPYMVRLLDSGKVVSHTDGPARWILLNDVLEYKNERKQKRREALSELVQESQRLGLY